MPISVKVPRTGRVRMPQLDNGPLTTIGKAMVAAQLVRWSKGINAEGNPAKKLSVKYAIIKQKTLHKKAIRDMQMTGTLAKNFALRKASNGVIKAENTSRLARDHARRADQYEQMIGFAGSDQITVFNEAEKQYGKWMQTAWIPVNG
jgi:hypothetical protein